MTLLAAIRSEIAKFGSTAGWWILGLVLVVYLGIVSGTLALILGGVATGALGGGRGGAIPGDVVPPLVYSVASAVGYVIPLLAGTLLVTAEYRHQTLTPTFLAVPRRGRALGAKVVVAALAGVGYALLALTASVAPGAAVLAALGLDAGLGEPDVQVVIARAGLALVLWTVLGVGLGTLVRNQVVAIVLVLAFTQFVEPLARAAASFVTELGPLTRILPGSASDALVGSSVFAVLTAAGQDDPLLWWQGGLVLAAYAAVLLVAGWLASWRRDVT